MNMISNQLNPKYLGFNQSNGFLSNKMYLAKQLSGVPTNEIYPQKYISPTGVYCDLVEKLRITNSLAESDYVLVPHDWVSIYKNNTYLRYLQDLSKDKPLLLFNTGDLSPKIKTKNTLEIRTFLHPWENSYQKIIIPYAVKARSFKLRSWKPKPTISFMGYVPKLTPGSLFGYNMKSLFHPISSSVYINRKLSGIRLNITKNKFEINFIKRDNFTAYYKNSNLKENLADFQNSLDNSDYILCPRGYGNTSIRFYESLSAGRTPILIDSKGALPVLDDNEPWSKHIVTVDILLKWVKLIEKDWSSLYEKSEYEQRQVKNYELFTKFLNYNSYLTALFTKYLK